MRKFAVHREHLIAHVKAFNLFSFAWCLKIHLLTGCPKSTEVVFQCDPVLYLCLDPTQICDSQIDCPNTDLDESNEFCSATRPTGHLVMLWDLRTKLSIPLHIMVEQGSAQEFWEVVKFTAFPKAGHYSILDYSCQYKIAGVPNHLEPLPLALRTPPPGT